MRIGIQRVMMFKACYRTVSIREMRSINLQKKWLEHMTLKLNRNERIQLFKQNFLNHSDSLHF